MLCVCGLHAVLSPFMNSSWSACRLQPEVKPLPCQQDLLLQLIAFLHRSCQAGNWGEEKKECCFYRWQEFRQQFDLPEGGKFHIQASKVCVREAETEVSMKRSFRDFLSPSSYDVWETHRDTRADSSTDRSTPAPG
uniref:Uncharacterized protein n=1 Tax=Maylandia zebra TaxID=106582 RepID=A0A3P9BKI7_9CICH